MATSSIKPSDNDIRIWASIHYWSFWSKRFYDE